MSQADTRQRPPNEEPSDVRHPSESTDSARMQRLDASMHRTMPLLAMAVLCLFTTSPLIAAVEGKWIAALVLLLALAGAWALLLPWLIAVLHSGPQLSLDERGLRTVLIGDIPWADVAGMHLRLERSSGEGGTELRHYLDLCLHHPQRYAAPFWLRKRTPRPHADYGVYPVPLHLFDTDPEQVYRLARLWRGADPAPFVADWQSDVPLDEVAHEIEEQRADAAARAAAQAVTAKTGDYAQRLRASQQDGEREAAAQARRGERALRRTQARRQAEQIRGRRDTWLFVAFVLALAVVAYLFNA